MTTKYKRLFLFFKLVVFAACMYYIVRCVLAIDPTQLKPVYVLNVLGAGFLYFLCTFLLALSWGKLLQFLRQAPIPFVDVFIVYFHSAMAKYIPSNVMHYAARHYMCRRFDLSQKNIFLGNLLEVALILMAAILLVAAFVLFEIVPLPEMLMQNRSLFRKLVIFFSGGVLVTLLILIRQKTRTLGAVKPFPLLKIVTVYAFYLLFFLATGLVLCFLFWSMNTGVAFTLKTMALIGFCYVCSWTLGFVTPGAPGGLGVREAVIVSILGPQIGTAIALTGAILFRLSTVFGELLGYLFAKYLQSQKAGKI